MGNNIGEKEIKNSITTLLVSAIYYEMQAADLLERGLGIKMDSFYKDIDEELEKKLFKKVRSGEYTMDDWQQLGDVVQRNKERMKRGDQPTITDRLMTLVEELNKLKDEIEGIPV